MKKQCFRCGETKSLEEFYKHPNMADGRLNKCKECTKQDARLVGKTDKRKAYEKKRWDTPERREAVYASLKRAKKADPERFAKYQRDYVAKYPERRAARVMLGNAVRDGRIKRQPCKSCGKKKGVQAHHRDYSKPLVVRWLCPACHGLEHRKA